MEEKYVVNNLPIIVFSLLLVASVIWFIRKIIRDNPDKNLGEIFEDFLMYEKETIFLIATIVINVAEAVFAASIHPMGEAPPNVFARIVSHSTVGALAIVSALAFNKSLEYVMSTFKIDRKKLIFSKDAKFAAKFWIRIKVYTEPITRILPALFLSLISLSFAVGFPLFNIFLIANGLKQWDNFYLFLQSIRWDLSHQELVAIYRYYGKPDTYSAFQGLSYAMASTVILAICHMFTMANHIVAKKTKVGKTLNEKINERGKKEKKEKLDETKFVTSTKYILNRYGFNDSNLDKWVGIAEKKLDSISDPKTKIAIAERAHVLKEKIEKLLKKKSKKEITQDEFKKKELEIKDEIYEFFKASPSKDNGMGITIKSHKKLDSGK